MKNINDEKIYVGLQYFEALMSENARLKTDLQRARTQTTRLRAELTVRKDESKKMISHGNKILGFLARFTPVPAWAWNFENKKEV